MEKKRRNEGKNIKDAGKIISRGKILWSWGRRIKDYWGKNESERWDWGKTLKKRKLEKLVGK